jgi:zinc transporter, ZIP family
MQTSYATVFFAGMLAAAGSGIGGCFGVLARTTRDTYDALLGFSAGVMIAAGSVALLWPAMRGGSAVTIVVGLLGGASLVLLMERIIPHVEPHFAPEISGAGKRLGLLVAIAMTIHHVPEGLSIGVAFAGRSAGLGPIIAASIGIQNVPEGLAVAVPLYAAGIRRWKAAAWAFGIALSQPFAALLGYWLSGLVAQLIPLALAAAAGAMIFVASDQLIPEVRHDPAKKAPSVGLVLGSVCVVLLSKLFQPL